MCIPVSPRIVETWTILSSGPPLPPHFGVPAWHPLILCSGTLSVRVEAGKPAPPSAAWTEKSGCIGGLCWRTSPSPTVGEPSPWQSLSGVESAHMTHGNPGRGIFQSCLETPAHHRTLLLKAQDFFCRESRLVSSHKFGYFFWEQKTLSSLDELLVYYCSYHGSQAISGYWKFEQEYGCLHLHTYIAVCIHKKCTLKYLPIFNISLSIFEIVTLLTYICANSVNKVLLLHWVMGANCFH